MRQRLRRHVKVIFIIASIIIFAFGVERYFALNQLPEPDATVAARLKHCAQSIGWSANNRIYSIDLSGNVLTAKDLDELVRLHHIDELSVYGCELPDESFAKIATISSLKSLSLAHTVVSDKEMVWLAKLPQLEVLDLNHTAISDDSIPYLRNADQLRRLYINKTKISQQGVEAIRKAMPLCQIQNQ